MGKRKETEVVKDLKSHFRVPKEDNLHFTLALCVDESYLFRYRLHGSGQDYPPPQAHIRCQTLSSASNRPTCASDADEERGEYF